MSEKKNKLTLDSKIGELYKNPVGHDTLSKVLLQLGLPESTLTNPVVANMKVSAVANLAKVKLDSGFFDTLLNLLIWKKMFRLSARLKFLKNGGRKLFFIRSTQEASVTAMGTESEI